MSSYYDDASLMLLASGGAQKDGKVYSVKPTDGSGDFTFTRGSNLSATRVNASQLIEKGRENLLLQSNQFDTTWGLSAAITITSGQSGYDGTNDAWLLKRSDANSRFIFQDITSSGVNTFSFFAKPESVNFVFVYCFNAGGNDAGVYLDLANGTVGNTSGAGLIDSKITLSTNGFYRCSLTINNLTQARMYPAVANGSVTGGVSNAGIYIQDAQLEKGLVATPYIETGATTAQAGILENTPRFDYSGGATCPSLLLEPSRSNGIAQSEYFSSWTLYAGILTPNATISPEGVQNAYLFTEDTTTGYHRFTSAASATSSNKLYSVYAKWAGGTGRKWLTVDNGPTAWFDLENGVVGAAQGSVVISMEDVGNGWYRCIYYNPASTTSGIFIGIALNNGGAGNHLGNGQPAFSVYGAQCEDNANYATSYIPTYGVSQTRAQDNSSLLGAGNILGQTEGVIFLQVGDTYNNADTGPEKWFLEVRKDAINSFGLSSGGGGQVGNPVIRFVTKINNVVRTEGEPPNFSNSKIAIKYTSTEFKLFQNGSLKITVPRNIGGYQDIQLMEGASNDLKMVTKQLLAFPTALSDLDLAILTGATTYNTFAAMALALNYTVYE